MKDEITGREIKEGEFCIFIDSRNWNPRIFHKGMTLERLNELLGEQFTEMPPIVIPYKEKTMQDAT